ncbi:hypothetical protein PR048_001171 [Dryococelus australis]|uniref:Uncharacterized protein n=1 Tax=Dryococelus australis TaxID=614101 RepID=A0ABQ9IGM8_9NEOP|nr:hypothetical protein PR048_001171 [Dryococelus australis]
MLGAGRRRARCSWCEWTRGRGIRRVKATVREGAWRTLEQCGLVGLNGYSGKKISRAVVFGKHPHLSLNKCHLVKRAGESEIERKRDREGERRERNRKDQKYIGSGYRKFKARFTIARQSDNKTAPTPAKIFHQTVKSKPQELDERGSKVVVAAPILSKQGIYNNPTVRQNSPDTDGNFSSAIRSKVTPTKTQPRQSDQNIIHFYFLRASDRSSSLGTYKTSAPMFEPTVARAIQNIAFPKPRLYDLTDAIRLHMLLAPTQFCRRHTTRVPDRKKGGGGRERRKDDFISRRRWNRCGPRWAITAPPPPPLHHISHLSRVAVEKYSGREAIQICNWTELRGRWEDNFRGLDVWRGMGGGGGGDGVQPTSSSAGRRRPGVERAARDTISPRSATFLPPPPTDLLFPSPCARRLATVVLAMLKGIYAYRNDDLDIQVDSQSHRQTSGESPCISTLASHQREPGSLPGRVTGFSQVGIALDDAVGRRVFSGISRFPAPFLLVPLHIHFNHPHRLSRSRSECRAVYSLVSAPRQLNIRCRCQPAPISGEKIEVSDLLVRRIRQKNDSKREVACASEVAGRKRSLDGEDRPEKGEKCESNSLKKDLWKGGGRKTTAGMHPTPSLDLKWQHLLPILNQQLAHKWRTLYVKHQWLAISGKKMGQLSASILLWHIYSEPSISAIDFLSTFHRWPVRCIVAGSQT